jgi:peptidoglycan/LPS O-acetylase OafA/YrhL
VSSVIFGGIIGLLVAVVYTIVTGKLKLTQHRIAYGMPARAAALLGLVPLMLLSAVSVRVGGIANMPDGIAIFLGTLVLCVIVMYGVAWPFGEEPRA